MIAVITLIRVNFYWADPPMIEIHQFHSNLTNFSHILLLPSLKIFTNYITLFTVSPKILNIFIHKLSRWGGTFHSWLDIENFHWFSATFPVKFGENSRSITSHAKKKIGSHFSWVRKKNCVGFFSSSLFSLFDSATVKPKLTILQLTCATFHFRLFECFRLHDVKLRESQITRITFSLSCGSPDCKIFDIQMFSDAALRDEW